MDRTRSKGGRHGRVPVWVSQRRVSGRVSSQGGCHGAGSQGWVLGWVSRCWVSGRFMVLDPSSEGVLGKV